MYQLRQARLPQLVQLGDTLHAWREEIATILAAMPEENGETRRAQELIERLRRMPDYVVPLGMFFYHLHRKQLSEAAECYETIIEDRQLQATLSIQYPWIAPLRSSPHWSRLARLMNLPG